jgi:hypothetical protein
LHSLPALVPWPRLHIAQADITLKIVFGPLARIAARGDTGRTGAADAFATCASGNEHGTRLSLMRRDETGVMLFELGSVKVPTRRKDF